MLDALQRLVKSRISYSYWIQCWRITGDPLGRGSDQRVICLQVAVSRYGIHVQYLWFGCLSVVACPDLKWAGLAFISEAECMFCSCWKAHIRLSSRVPRRMQWLVRRPHQCDLIDGWTHHLSTFVGFRQRAVALQIHILVAQRSCWLLSSWPNLILIVRIHEWPSRTLWSHLAVRF